MKSDNNNSNIDNNKNVASANKKATTHSRRRSSRPEQGARRGATAAAPATEQATDAATIPTMTLKQKKKNEKGEAPPAPKAASSSSDDDEGTVDGPANTKDGFKVDPPLPSPSSPSSSSSPSDNDPPPPLPEAQFQIFQTVFARDTDGVMYEAVIRRKLYGRAQSQPQQVPIGLDSSLEHETSDNNDHKNDDEHVNNDTNVASMWHYFVHYNKWNVNWDRWVPETHVYEPTDAVRLYATTLINEHKALRSELTRKVKGKKGFQTVEGTEFLQKWRIRMARVDAELHPDLAGAQKKPAEGKPTKPQPDPPIAPKKKAAGAGAGAANPWTTPALAAERQLRLRGLTGRKVGGDPTASSSSSHSLILPFALKKHLVDAWEIITQCGMVVALPAPVTIRQALDAYVQSKGVQLPSSKSGEVAASAGTENPTGSATGDGSHPPLDSPTPRDLGIDCDAVISPVGREWHDMADGVALLFDEALPRRLLYREEVPQFYVLCDQQSPLRVSEVYGVEHLLRLLVNLPEALFDAMDDDDDESLTRPILAKVNDLIRYLHKNQEVVFTQSYRRLNALEIQAQVKLRKMEERKRRRRSGEVVVVAATDGSVAGAAAAAATHKRVNCGPDKK